MIKNILSATFAIIATGCANTPEGGFNYGHQPNDSEQKTALMAHLESSMFDFDSIKQFKINTPVKCHWKIGNYGMAYETAFGWCYIYELNGKNRYGAYTGIQRNIWKVYTDGTKGRMLTAGEELPSLSR